MSVFKATKKPVTIEAIQWTGENLLDVCIFTDVEFLEDTLDSVLTIETLEGDMRAELGDYIIKGVQGEFYPCKPEIFNATYNIHK